MNLCYIREKNANEMVKTKISKKREKDVRSHVPTGKMVSRSKCLLCSVSADRQDRQIERHESEYRRHPFRFSYSISFNLSSRMGPITHSVSYKYNQCHRRKIEPWEENQHTAGSFINCLHEINQST